MKHLLTLLIFIVSIVYSNDVTIATGEDTGNYYKIGKEINSKVYKNKAKLLKTSGSVENMLLVADGKADIALVQEDALSMLDIIYQIDNLNKYDLVDIVGYLYTEHLHILVNKNSKIKSIKQLDGKKVSYGSKKSGSSVTATFVEEQYKINFGEVVNTSIEKGLDLLSKNKIDAVFYVTKAPSKLLSKYKNLRLLESNIPIKDNPDIKIDTLSKKDYAFLDKDIKTYSVNTIVIVKKNSSELENIRNYLLSKGIKPKDNKKIQKNILKTGTTIKLPRKTLDLYTRRYGNRALFRFNYINKYLDKINALPKPANKLRATNLLVNKIYFLEDKVHWNKNNYWATPLEFIGTGAGDTEEFALLKLLILSKLGFDNTKFKIIKKNTSLKIKNKKINENIVLAYYFDKTKPPIIFDYKPNSPKINLYKGDYKFTPINKIENPIWKKALLSKLSEKDINDIFTNLK
ncbi:MAG: TAXI family TRAP transporter solute-binding subunit [Halarcobacter sp.]